MTQQDPRTEILQTLAGNKRLAHSFLFAHRHPDPSPPFHDEIIDLWHSSVPQVLIMASRGSAKSTLSEECITIGALFKSFRYALIIGNSETRAVERLTAVKHEIEFNEKIQNIFDDQVGTTWQEKAIVLKNGTAIHAYGRGQSLRGAKHLDARPDVVFLDDFEDDESVQTPEQRQKTLNWFVSVLIPAMDPKHKIRIVGTPLDPEALLPTLAKSSSWTTRVYPIRYLSPTTHEPTSLWPERFPLARINEIERSYMELGKSDKFAQEYLCEATDPASRTFTSDMIRVDPSLKRTWEPVYVFYDPARTTNKTSADTGRVAFSWVGPRLIVWEASGHNWKPDQIINDIFETDMKYDPIEVGVEKDGLEEFLMQPIRHEQSVRNHTVPVVAYKAPKGKIDFIKGLQPFFKAGDVVFAQACPDLQNQLLAFPTGKIDVPNALAYALKMRPGKPVFDNFRMEHVAPGLTPVVRTPMRIALAATQQYTAGVLFQFSHGQIRVLSDDVVEGPPGDSAVNILRTLSMEAGQAASVYASPAAFNSYDRVGLLATLKTVPVAVTQGGPIARGREELRAALAKTVQGQPAVQVSPNASWTLRGLSGGYAREIDRLGQISDFPKENVYKVVLEALESVVSLAVAAETSADENVHYAYTADGQRFISARAR